MLSSAPCQFWHSAPCTLLYLCAPLPCRDHATACPSFAPWWHPVHYFLWLPVFQAFVWGWYADDTLCSVLVRLKRCWLILFLAKGYHYIFWHHAPQQLLCMIVIVVDTVVCSYLPSSSMSIVEVFLVANLCAFDVFFSTIEHCLEEIHYHSFPNHQVPFQFVELASY